MSRRKCRGTATAAALTATAAAPPRAKDKFEDAAVVRLPPVKADETDPTNCSIWLHMR
jgi:hypothetical protein